MAPRINESEWFDPVRMAEKVFFIFTHPCVDRRRKALASKACLLVRALAHVRLMPNESLARVSLLVLRPRSP